MKFLDWSRKFFTSNKTYAMLAILGAFGLYYLKTQKKKPSFFSKFQDLNQSKFLTQKMAELRGLQITNHSIHYELTLRLMKGQFFEGVMSSSFKLNHLNDDLFIEYRGLQIKSLTINGQIIPEENIQWNKLFIILPKETLNLDVNNIQIHYFNRYAGDGCGLHSYVDVDQKIIFQQPIVMTKNHHILSFPCFDQPDLKATMKFIVVCVNEWTVISNENSLTIQPFNPNCFQGMQTQLFEGLDKDSYKIWIFDETPRLSSYLFVIVAGNYCKITSDIKHNSVTFNLYCRESLQEHLERMKDFVIEVTLKSLQFYEKFFGINYQFNKYDSVFVTEYNWGAMENAGCVTYNDTYVFKEKQSGEKYTRFANTIAHEMAHHWFGNYVTMKWWNDVWLNESYADFISHYCLENIKIESIPLTSIPVMFNLRKGWGYREDQMSTTHPIAGEVPNTEVAENIFDGITYSKGAASMRQLMHLISPEVFGRACGNYFKKYAWQNAVLDNLIQELNNEAKDIDLFQWKDEWIKQAGMNEIEPEWDISNVDAEAILKVKQTAALPQFPTLRKHKMKIGLVKEDCKIDALSVTVQNTEVSEFKYDGSKQYKAVVLNYEDQTFIKILLDEQSMLFFKQNLYKIDDFLTRTLVWRAFYDMVRDGKISSVEYMEIVLYQLPKESSDEIVSTQLLYLHAAAIGMTPRKYRKLLAKTIFEYLCKELKLMSNDENQFANRILIYRDSLFNFCQNDESIDYLLKWKDLENEDLSKIKMTLANKWSIVNLVNASKKYENDFKTKILEEVCNEDKTDKTTKMRRRCAAYVANKEERVKLWAMFSDPNNKESAKIQAESMSGFNNSRRIDELEEYYDKFFECIIQVFQQKSTDYAKVFYDYLYPASDDLPKLEADLQLLLLKVPSNCLTLKKNVEKSIDEAKRQQRVYNTFEQRAKMIKQ